MENKERGLKQKKRRELRGVVTSDKMDKTVVVKVSRSVKQPKFKKYITRSQRVKAHDAKNEAKSGDLVRLVESRPLSRDKRWVMTTVIRRAGADQLTGGAN